MELKQNLLSEEKPYNHLIKLNQLMRKAKDLTFFCGQYLDFCQRTAWLMRSAKKGADFVWLICVFSEVMQSLRGICISSCYCLTVSFQSVEQNQSGINLSFFPQTELVKSSFWSFVSLQNSCKIYLQFIDIFSVAFTRNFDRLTLSRSCAETVQDLCFLLSRSKAERLFELSRSSWN